MYTYNYIEDEIECNICYETKLNLFKCIQYNFKGCCSCFNKIFFEEDSKWPICRLKINF